MATVTPNSSFDGEASIAISENNARTRRRTPNHAVASCQSNSSENLKYIPGNRSLRNRIRGQAGGLVDKLDKTQTLGKHDIESLARQLLAELCQPEAYLGWTMVVLLSEFWREQVQRVPLDRRLLLLPHDSSHSTDCVVAEGRISNVLSDGNCVACVVDEVRHSAQALGYRVLLADSSSAVSTAILSGRVEAIVGLATLDVLEKAIDKILLSGIPCMAVSLLADADSIAKPNRKTTANSSIVDLDWVREMIDTIEQTANGEHTDSDIVRTINSSVQQPTPSYLHLMRAAANLFERKELEQLVPRLRGGPSLAEANGRGIAGIDPIAGTEVIAYDFLSRGGKHSRPFITLAVYDAMTGGNATLSTGAEHIAGLPAAIKRVAMSIETFHKASLVHDDIEDDDAFRYGEPTLHRKYGTPTAINVGDYLIGLGYRLVSRESKTLGAEVVADILDRLADAHLKLSEGQGAELLWRDARDKRLSSRDALNIYALKTSPAFEAALFSGLRLAGPIEPYLEPVSQFARYLGIAFQILNDLGDWRGDDHNKLLAAGDVLGGRPTVLWALALEGLSDEQRVQLQTIAGQHPVSAEMISQVRQLYTDAGVFDQATRLIDTYRQRAEAVADTLQPAELSRLFRYLIETVLDGARG